VTSLLSTATIIIVLLGTPTIGTTAWTHTERAPFVGTDIGGLVHYSSGAFTGSFSNSGQTFAFSNGSGGFNESVSASSSSLPAGGGSRGPGVVGGWSGLYATVEPKLQVPFLSHSGTRNLSYVNVTITLDFWGSLTFVAGICPWVKAAKSINYCSTELAASNYLVPGSLTNFKGRDASIGVCTQGCSGGSASIGNDSTNTSRGLSALNGSTTNGTATFSGSATVSIVYVPKTPITGSQRLSVVFGETATLFAEMECKRGAGGLTGASLSGYIGVSMTLVSVVEK
jgi:hypothetical protein